jgi:hypothetical protein
MQCAPLSPPFPVIQLTVLLSICGFSLLSNKNRSIRISGLVQSTQISLEAVLLVSSLHWRQCESATISICFLYLAIAHESQAPSLPTQALEERPLPLCPLLQVRLLTAQLPEEIVSRTSWRSRNQVCRHSLSLSCLPHFLLSADSVLPLSQLSKKPAVCCAQFQRLQWTTAPSARRRSAV